MNLDRSLEGKYHVSKIFSSLFHDPAGKFRETSLKFSHGLRSLFPLPIEAINCKKNLRRTESLPLKVCHLINFIAKSLHIEWMLVEIANLMLVVNKRKTCLT